MQEERPPLKIADPDTCALTSSGSPAQSNASTPGPSSPFGETTFGTISISDRVDDVRAVRVYGALGRVRLLRCSLGSKEWETR